MIKSLQERVAELEEANEENLDKYGAAMDNCSRAHDRNRMLEQQLKQRDDTTRLNATRFGDISRRSTTRRRRSWQR